MENGPGGVPILKGPEVPIIGQRMPKISVTYREGAFEEFLPDAFEFKSGLLFMDQGSTSIIIPLGSIRKIEMLNPNTVLEGKA